MGEMIRVENVCYTYSSKYQQTEVLHDISCGFESGKMYAITGKSGSGKSTLLSLLAGLDLPTKGEITIEGQSIRDMDRDDYRKNTVSVIYQAFHLFPLLTNIENVMFPLQLKHMDHAAAKEQARKLLSEVEIGEEKFRKFPSMISGGEQQRVAIARALACEGKILLADEPSGNLDSVNEENIIRHLQRVAHDKGYLVITVTHNEKVAEAADVIFRLADGRLEEIIEK